MRFLTMILLSFYFMPVAQADDDTYRQACLDELQTEINGVCSPQVQSSASTLSGMVKNVSLIRDTDDRVRKICSYHCPQDIADTCHALLDRGANFWKSVWSGDTKRAPNVADSCKLVQAKMADARKITGNVAAASGNGETAKAATGDANVKGSFRKVSSVPCNPYNESGAFVMGKCPN